MLSRDSLPNLVEPLSDQRWLSSCAELYSIIKAATGDGGRGAVGELWEAGEGRGGQRGGCG